MIHLFGSFVPIFIIGYQVFTYLQTGTWVPISIITLFKWIGMPWAINPQNWFGMYNILDAMPLSITVFVLSIVIALISDE